MPSAAPVMMRIKPAVSSSVAFARIFGPTIVNTVESAVWHLFVLAGSVLHTLSVFTVII